MLALKRSIGVEIDKDLSKFLTKSNLDCFMFFSHLVFKISSIISCICSCMGCELLILQYLSNAWSLLLLKHSARLLKKTESADDKTYTFQGLKNMIFNFCSYRQKKSRRNETKPCFISSLRHRYANASHDAGIPLSNIEAAMDHTTEVHHQSYERFILGGTLDLYAKRNARFS